jgi:hypothetical protein
VLVNLKTRLLEVPDHTLGELLAGIVRHVLFHDPSQEIAAARDSKADREPELVAEAALIHRDDVLVLFYMTVIVRRPRKPVKVLGDLDPMFAALSQGDPSPVCRSRVAPDRLAPSLRHADQQSARLTIDPMWFRFAVEFTSGQQSGRRIVVVDGHPVISIKPTVDRGA